MRPETKKLLTDMLAAAVEIQSFTSGRTFDEFQASKQLRWSVERGFEIIGEALAQLYKIDKQVAESISDWRAIVDFRNVLIHGYAAVNARTVWDVVQTELPVLRAELESMLNQ